MDKSLLIGKFITVEFGKRKFYLPKVSCNIFISNDRLKVFLGDNDYYAIVDGIRCGYDLTYEADSDTLHTHLLNYEIDGVAYNKRSPFSFPLSATTFTFDKKELGEVKIQRDYAEVVTAYLSERPDLDKRVVKFLENHPESFDQVESIDCWRELSVDLPFIEEDGDNFAIFDLLPKHIAEAFIGEFGL